MAKNQLSAEDIEILRKARESQKQIYQSGMDVSGEMIDTSTPVVNHETYITISDLPSGGFFYPNQISGQPLKVEDLLLVQSLNERNSYKVFSEIFSRRLRGVEHHDILVCDEIYLALWLRANSYPGYNFPHDGFTCSNPACGIDIPSGAVEFGFMDMDFTPSNLDVVKAKFGGKNSTTLALKSGRNVTMYMKRRKHMARVEHLLNRDFYVYGNRPSDELVQLLNIASIVTFDEGMDIMDVVQMLKSLSPVEFSDLISQIKKYTITGEPSIGLTCPACTEVTRFSGYSFQPDIYIPLDE